MVHAPHPQSLYTPIDVSRGGNLPTETTTSPARDSYYDWRPFADHALYTHHHKEPRILLSPEILAPRLDRINT